MSSNDIPILRLNECQSLDEAQPQQTRQRIRSHSLNPDTNTIRKVKLNNCAPEVHDLNNRLDQLVKKYRNLNTSYFANQTLDEIKSAYQTQFNTWNEKFNKIVVEKTRLKLVNDSLNEKLSKTEKNLARLKEELENSVSSLNLQLKQNIEKYTNSAKEWQTIDAQYVTAIDKIKSELVDEKKKTTSLENKYLILQKELEFRNSLFEKEVAEYKRISELSHKTIENKVRDELDGQYEIFKDELLKKVAEEKSILSENLNRTHNNRISQMEANIKSIERRKEAAENELKEERKKTESLKNDNEKLNIDFKKKIESLEQEIKIKDDIHKNFNAEMEALRKEFDREIEERVSLEKEIRKYKKIIEDAERHMNITPNSTSSPQTFNSPEIANRDQSDHGVISPIISSSLNEYSEDEVARKRRRLQIDLEADPHISYKKGQFLVEYNAKDRIQRENNIESEQGPVSFFNIFNYRKKK